MENLEYTPITKEKPFPPSWNTILLHVDDMLDFYRNINDRHPTFELFSYDTDGDGNGGDGGDGGWESKEEMHIKDKKEENKLKIQTINWDEFVQEVFNRSNEVPDCLLFKKISIPADRLMKISAKSFLFGYDTEIDQTKDRMIGVFSLMYIGDFFLMEEISTGNYHFTVKVQWRCSLTNTSEVSDHYRKLKNDYELYSGKYLQIELMNLMNSLLHNRQKFIDYEHDEDMVNEEFSKQKIKKVSNITVVSCSLHEALPRHLKNGAKIMTDLQRQNYRVISSKSTFNPLTECNPLPLIYWTIPYL